MAAAVSAFAGNPMDSKTSRDVNHRLRWKCHNLVEARRLVGSFLLAADQMRYLRGLSPR